MKLARSKQTPKRRDQVRHIAALTFLLCCVAPQSVFAQSATAAPQQGTASEGQARSEPLAASRSEGAGSEDDGQASPSSSEQAGATESPSSRPRFSDSVELDRIIEQYMAGNYSLCAAELEVFLEPRSGDSFSDEGVIERGRLYFATCSLLLGRRDQARAALRDALEENPLMASPDSLTFPPPVVSLFLEVRDEMQQIIADREREQVLLLRRENEIARRKAEQRLLREEQLEKLAAEESVVRQNSRWIAALPFGAGQYQNGNSPLGTFFLVAEGVLAATSLTSALILESMTSRAASSSQTPDKARYDGQTMAAYRVMTYSSWGLLGVYAAGVTEAQISFKKERRLPPRPRPLPPELKDDELTGEAPSGQTNQLSPAPSNRPDSANVRFSPTAAVLPGGGYLGVMGSF